MFLPWRDHSFLFDEDDLGVLSFDTVLLEKISIAALYAEINQEEEVVTGVQFRETGTETFHEEMHYFDNIAPSDDIPNHLLLLYLTTGLFFFVSGLLMIFRDNNLFHLCCCFVIFGSVNIGFQVKYINPLI